jgi:predicted nuclease with RNAse H fold
MEPGVLVFRVHALRRMARRGISVDEVREALGSGEIIETYPDDMPYPSRLVLGRTGSRHLHVVVADDPGSGHTIVITVYEPDPARWGPDFRRRQEP